MYRASLTPNLGGSAARQSVTGPARGSRVGTRPVPQMVPPSSASAAQPPSELPSRNPPTGQMADPARTRPKRVHDKPWIELGMTKTTYTRTQTPWGKEELTKKAWLEKKGLSPYLYEKLKRGEAMRAQMAREAEVEAEAAAAAAASQGHGQSTKRKLDEAAMDEEDEAFDEDEDYDDDDDDDDDDSSDDGCPRRAGAPSPDSDADYIP